MAIIVEYRNLVFLCKVFFSAMARHYALTFVLAQADVSGDSFDSDTTASFGLHHYSQGSKMRHVATRMSRIAPFHVMDILARARALESAGRSIIHMEIGTISRRSLGR